MLSGCKSVGKKKSVAPVKGSWNLESGGKLSGLFPDLAFTTSKRHRGMTGSFLCMLELYGGCCCVVVKRQNEW